MECSHNFLATWQMATQDQDPEVWLPKVGKIVMLNGDVCPMECDTKCAGVLIDITDYWIPRFQTKATGTHPAIVCNPTGDLAITIGDYLVNYDGRLRLATAEEAAGQAVCGRANETHVAEAGVTEAVLKVSMWL